LRRRAPLRRAPLAAGLAALIFPFALAASCFDSGLRWEEVTGPAPAASTCELGATRCSATALERCDEGPEGPAWATAYDCATQGLVCVPSLLACKPCAPGERTCDGSDIVVCRDDASGAEVIDTCDAAAGAACRNGGCTDLCALAAEQRSNVGCEYWAVDLDNARISSTSNAAAQQFAVVVSNAQPDVPADVRIYQDDSLPGEENAPYEIASGLIPPLNLLVFKLGPREVDGSPDGEFNAGTHTALTRHAFKIVSNFPVVAYQFSPLENANVFSNDASLLKPREALTYEGDALVTSYVVAGWPQTIAKTDDPSTNFNPLYPINLRAFLTIVGTREATTVRVRTKAKIVGGGPVAETPINGMVEATLGPFDVLNLETGDFNADFTGSIIESDGPIAVFSGTEASDAPHFETLADRRCCADHLEDQLDPVRTAGKRFAVAHSPNRGIAVNAAGAVTGVVPEPDYVRFVAATTKGALIRTTLPPPLDEIVLGTQGAYREVEVTGDFMAESSDPIIVAQVMASQDAAGVKRGLPGGDPSLVIFPPIEQFRPDYVFLTPDKYAFDFVTVVAPPDATVLLDDEPIGPELCEVAAADGLTPEERGDEVPPFVVYRCQLSFPSIDPLSSPPVTTAGEQHDGVHRILANAPVGVIITGFDSYVSYGYAGGTELREIAQPE
jgi:hypothetical protein